MVQGHDTASDMIGRVFFGEYTIVDRLGEGGMGAVYLAEQNQIDQRIALKVLHTESAESDEIIQRFHREANVISMLSHPNIVRVFIFGRTEDDLLFLAMEFVDGHELREDMTQGEPLDELRAIKITKQICSAVAEAHDLSIIHRDLKPENVLLTTHRDEEDFVKILDFGIAKLKYPDDQQGPKLTQAGIVYGTPEYLSPEQAQAEDLDHRTDIYSLGCMLYEMMTGQVPFSAEASVDILKQQVFEDPTPPSDIADVAPTMENIIHKAMEKDREDRYNNALEMFDDLVHREEEIRSERQVDRRDTWFPGSELTGVHNVIDDQLDDERETIDRSPDTGTSGSHPDAPAAQSGSFTNADTAVMESPRKAASESNESVDSTPNPGTTNQEPADDDSFEVPPTKISDGPGPTPSSNSSTPQQPAQTDSPSQPSNSGTPTTDSNRSPEQSGAVELENVHSTSPERSPSQQEAPTTHPAADPTEDDGDETIRHLLKAGIILATTVIIALVLWISYMLYLG